MGFYLHNNEAEMIADFYRNPSYQKLAMINSVIKTGGTKSSVDFFNESKLYTDMLLTLKSYEKEKQSAGEKLAEDVIKIAEDIISSTLGTK